MLEDCLRFFLLEASQYCPFAAICPAPPSPINGTLSNPNASLSGQTSRLICPPDFQPSMNSITIMCTPNTTWDLQSEAFYCERERECLWHGELLPKVL